MCQDYHKKSWCVSFFIALFQGTHVCIYSGSFMDHATGTISLYKMGELCNMKSLLCYMRTECTMGYENCAM